MELIEVRKIIAFSDNLEYLPDCMRDTCYNKALYVLVVTSGPKKGAMYLICEECLVEYKAKAQVIPVHTN